MTEASWGPLPGPSDPRAGRAGEAPTVLRPGGRRPVFGFVYELQLAGQSRHSCSYVGKCKGSSPAAVEERVHGRSHSAHTSAQSIARDPWKAEILPGRDGWRILERVYATGDDAADEERLRRAESDWIDRKRPVRNRVRPVRPFGEAPKPQPRRPVVATPARPPSARELAKRKREAARKRRVAFRLALILLLAAAFTYLAARVVLAMHLPWPSVTWWLPPALGVLFAWITFVRMTKAAKKITR